MPTTIARMLTDLFYWGKIAEGLAGIRSRFSATPQGDCGNSLTELTPVIKEMVPTGEKVENGTVVALLSTSALR